MRDDSKKKMQKDTAESKLGYDKGGKNQEVLFSFGFDFYTAICVCLMSYYIIQKQSTV